MIPVVGKRVRAKSTDRLGVITEVGLKFCSVKYEHMPEASYFTKHLDKHVEEYTAESTITGWLDSLCTK